MGEPGVDGGVQDKTGHVVIVLLITATTCEDETVCSENGGMSVQGKRQGGDRAGASKNLDARLEKSIDIIIEVKARPPATDEDN